MLLGFKSIPNPSTVVGILAIKDQTITTEAPKISEINARIDLALRRQATDLTCLPATFQVIFL